jgi:hypothetical protein
MHFFAIILQSVSDPRDVREIIEIAAVVFGAGIFYSDVRWMKSKLEHVEEQLEKLSDKLR